CTVVYVYLYSFPTRRSSDLLGLIPLAVGLNIDFFGLFTDYNPNIYFGGDNVIFWGPLAWNVIFGLVFATFLTLVVVPAMFYLVKDRKSTRLNSSHVSISYAV